MNRVKNLIDKVLGNQKMLSNEQLTLSMIDAVIYGSSGVKIEIGTQAAIGTPQVTTTGTSGAVQTWTPKVQVGDEIEMLSDYDGYGLKVGTRLLVKYLALSDNNIRAEEWDGNYYYLPTFGEDRLYRIVGPHSQHSQATWDAKSASQVTTTSAGPRIVPTSGIYQIISKGSPHSSQLPSTLVPPKEEFKYKFDNSKYEELETKYGLD